MVDKDIKQESESVNLMWSLIASILNAISNYKEVCWDKVVQTLSLVSFGMWHFYFQVLFNNKV